VLSTIAAAGEEVLVLIGVRQAANLAEAIRAAKASFPDAAVVVVGDACKAARIHSTFSARRRWPLAGDLAHHFAAEIIACW
jgi:hypothetical protein